MEALLPGQLQQHCWAGDGLEVQLRVWGHSRAHLAGGRATESPCTSSEQGTSPGWWHSGPQRVPAAPREQAQRRALDTAPIPCQESFPVIVPQLGIKPARSSLAQPAEHVQDQD